MCILIIIVSCVCKSFFFVKVCNSTHISSIKLLICKILERRVYEHLASYIIAFSRKFLQARCVFLTRHLLAGFLIFFLAIWMKVCVTDYWYFRLLTDFIIFSRLPFAVIFGSSNSKRSYRHRFVNVNHYSISLVLGSVDFFDWNLLFYISNVSKCDSRS